MNCACRRLSSQQLHFGLSCRTRGTRTYSWDGSQVPGVRANPQLMSLLSLQPAHSLLCAGFVTQATWARRLANWCEQYYLFSDLWEWRSDSCEKSLPPFLPPSQACGEVLTGLVSCHLCLGYPAIACTARASARLMALGQLASMVRTAVKYLLSACGATAPGM